MGVSSKPGAHEANKAEPAAKPRIFNVSLRDRCLLFSTVSQLISLNELSNCGTREAEFITEARRLQLEACTTFRMLKVLY